MKCECDWRVVLVCLLRVGPVRCQSFRKKESDGITGTILHPNASFLCPQLLAGSGLWQNPSSVSESLMWGCEQWSSLSSSNGHLWTVMWQPLANGGTHSSSGSGSNTTADSSHFCPLWNIHESSRCYAEPKTKRQELQVHNSPSQSNMCEGPAGGIER